MRVFECSIRRRGLAPPSSSSGSGNGSPRYASNSYNLPRSYLSDCRQKAHASHAEFSYHISSPMLPLGPEPAPTGQPSQHGGLIPPLRLLFLRLIPPGFLLTSQTIIFLAPRASKINLQHTHSLTHRHGEEAAILAMACPLCRQRPSRPGQLWLARLSQQEMVTAPASSRLLRQSIVSGGGGIADCPRVSLVSPSAAPIPPPPQQQQQRVE